MHPVLCNRLAQSASLAVNTAEICSVYRALHAQLVHLHCKPQMAKYATHITLLFIVEMSLHAYRSGKDYATVLAANVVGPFLVTKHFLPLFKKKKTRVVVNSSSICGSISATVSGGIGGENPLASVLLPYNTSKAALNMRKPPCLIHAL